jgi:biotin transport system substrate-specific component
MTGMNIMKIESLCWEWFHWRKQARVTDKLFLSLLGATIIGLSSLVRIYIPGTPVPITGQTFSVLLMGVLMGAETGALSSLWYILLGGCGIPWFTGAAGWAVLVGPTAGYMFGFIPAAYFTGYCLDHYKELRSFGGLLGIMILADLLLIHLPGMLWLSYLTGIHSAGTILAIGSLPFIPGDLVKILAAAGISRCITPKTHF